MPRSMIHKIMLSAGFILALQPVSAQSELDRYLKTAAGNNPGLKAAFNEYMAAMEKVPQVGSLPDPAIAFGYFVSPVETRVGPQEFKISAGQAFPWFGLLNAREDVYTELAKAKLELFEEEKSKLFYEVKSAYYSLYFIRKGLDIMQKNINILHTFRQLALISYEAGKASAVDELRVEMELSDLENQLAYLQDSKYQMQVAFNNLLNESNDAPIIIPDSLWEATPKYERSAIMDSIAVQNHRIKQLEHQMSSWGNQEMVAKKSGMPEIMVGVEYTIIGKSDNPMLDPGENGRDASLLPRIGISIPLYREKYKALLRETLLEHEAAGLEKESEVNRLSTLFETGYKNYRDGVRRVNLYAGQLQLAQKALDIMLTTYATDGQNFEEVLRMERRLLTYSLELDKGKSDRNAAVAFIEYLMGK